MTRSKGLSIPLLLKVLIGALGGAALVIAVLLWSALREPCLGGDFELTERGRPWTFSVQPKKLNILYIGYAKCPDVCPMTLAFTAEAFRGLDETERKNVRLLFLSVDRDNDRPDDVADYAAQFFPDFIGLSGSREQIDKTVSMFNASYIVEKNPKSYLGYSIVHTDRLFFLNSAGIQIATIPTPRSSELILKTIKENL